MTKLCSIVFMVGQALRDADVAQHLHAVFATAHEQADIVTRSRLGLPCVCFADGGNANGEKFVILSCSSSSFKLRHILISSILIH